MESVQQVHVLHAGSKQNVYSKVTNGSESNLVSVIFDNMKMKISKPRGFDWVY